MSIPLSGVLTGLTSMNLVVYLVHGRVKMFEHEYLQAVESLHDGFVKCVWLYQCPVSNDLNLRVLHFRAYVHHSLSCESPLEVYVA